MTGHRKQRLAVIVTLIAAYFLLQWFVSRLDAPAISLPEPQARQRFPVDIILPDIDGKTVRLADFHGRPVLVNLWATWCYPCRTEMPAMQALYAAYREQGFVILAIATDKEGHQIVGPFVQAYGLTFPVLLDPHNTLGAQLHIAGLPTSYVLDKQGRIAGMEVGARQWDRAPFRRLLEQLLAESAGRAELPVSRTEHEARTP